MMVFKTTGYISMVQALVSSKTNETMHATETSCSLLVLLYASSSGLFERSEARSLRQDPSEAHLLRSNRSYRPRSLRTDRRADLELLSRASHVRALSHFVQIYISDLSLHLQLRKRSRPQLLVSRIEERSSSHVVDKLIELLAVAWLVLTATRSD